jgi:hypothetical protein
LGRPRKLIRPSPSIFLEQSLAWSGNISVLLSVPHVGNVKNMVSASTNNKWPTPLIKSPLSGTSSCSIVSMLQPLPGSFAPNLLPKDRPTSLYMAYKQELKNNSRACLQHTLLQRGGCWTCQERSLLALRCRPTLSVDKTFAKQSLCISFVCGVTKILPARPPDLKATPN